MGLLKAYYLSLQEEEEEEEEEESSSTPPSDPVEQPPMEEDPPTYEAPKPPHYLTEPVRIFSPPTYEAPEPPHYMTEPFALPSPSDLLNDLQSCMDLNSEQLAHYRATLQICYEKAMEGLDSKDYAETYMHFQMGEYCGRSVVETLELINSLKATMRYITELNSDHFGTKKRGRECQREEEDPITLGVDSRRSSVFRL